VSDVWRLSDKSRIERPRKTKIGTEVAHITRECRKRPPIYVSCMTISGGTTEQHIVIGFGRAGCSRLEYVDIRLVY